MDNLTKLYRIRRTCLQMLADRGYLVSQEDLNLSKDDFRNRFGENPRKEDLTILVPKQDDPTEQVRVPRRVCGVGRWPCGRRRLTWPLSVVLGTGGRACCCPMHVVSSCWGDPGW